MEIKFSLQDRMKYLCDLKMSMYNKFRLGRRYKISNCKYKANGVYEYANTKPPVITGNSKKYLVFNNSKISSTTAQIKYKRISSSNDRVESFTEVAYRPYFYAEEDEEWDDE